MSSSVDRRYMKQALALARRGLGQVAPNPAVGCVLVRFDEDPAGRLVGRGSTGAGGRPHAETLALEMAGEAARGATAFVTLEPCSHQGQTPPCAEALIAAGVSRVVSALEDPDPRVAGRGHAALEEAGVSVDVGLLDKEAEALNKGFLTRIKRGRPMVTVKIATSLDGRIATHTGDSQWITSGAARERAHLLRAQSDAIMIGSNTALQDNPMLTCRLPGLEGRSPLRVICDGRLRLPLTSKLCQTARDVPTLLITLEGADPLRRQAYEDCGLDVIQISEGQAGSPHVGAALQALGARGLTRVLVEGGGHLIASLMAEGLIDEVQWFRAPKVIGGDGLPAVGAFGVDDIVGAAQLVRQSVMPLGEDLVETYAVRH